ncbi:MAG: hypothetical protein Q7T48_08340 [Cellvibrio sp.]|uniref:hypothetical protein n=1 Tax=Cellvibrio sp. TaxID=1965322 RepID=UPI0027276C36|nr:hypothetical protein [Cellvibrio sp.]
MKISRCIFFAAFLIAHPVDASQFCFALAATYYEQVYCQLQAKAQTKGLPPFNQFKKNNEVVQASLLKRPAERNGIKLPAPVRKVQSPVATITPPKIINKPLVSGPKAVVNEPEAKPSRSTSIESKNSLGCELLANQIYCGNQKFKLVGNKANHRLANSALSIDNKMDLPTYQGGVLSHYLARAYTQYIDKMCDIGLCGVTMTYGKFAYLYQDLRTKGLDFSQRFEIMYGFLKKDKANMGVSESSSAPKGLSLHDCSTLGDARYICDYQGRNYIFEMQ